MRAPLGLFFGWCSVATFATAAITASMRRNPWYAGAVAWALAAVAVANARGTNRPVSLAIAAAAALGAAVVLGALARRRRGPDAGPYVLRAERAHGAGT